MWTKGTVDDFAFAFLQMSEIVCLHADGYDPTETEIWMM